MILDDDVLAIGLGGNIGTEPEIRARFDRARSALAQLGDLRSASLYRTAAIGPPQPAFLNTALRIRIADATPDELLHTIRELELLLGRDRASETRWGPRTIDLDILMWGTRLIRTPDLEIPHPRLTERRFVLDPLIEIFSEDLIVPGTNRTLGHFARLVRGQVVGTVSTLVHVRRALLIITRVHFPKIAAKPGHD